MIDAGCGGRNIQRVIEEGCMDGKMHIMFE